MLVATELRQCRGERLRTQDAGLALVEHTEARIDASSGRVGPKQSMAEAMDGRDPGTVQLAGEVCAADLDKPGPDPRSKLARRAFCERHDEDRADVDPALHRTDEALDDDRRLAGAGAGGDEHRPRRVD